MDIGGESTRPGSRAVPAREEIRRILPVVEALSGRLPVPISVDTTKSEVAAAALEAGAEVINDVSGLSFDPRMAEVAARYRAGLILSHIQGRPRTMQKNPRYRHLIPEVLAFLRDGVRQALKAGVETRIDPHRPRDRVREVGLAQPHAPEAPQGPAGHGVPGHGGGLPEVLPGETPGEGPGPRGPAGCEPGRRRRGDLVRRLGPAGPRRGRHGAGGALRGIGERRQGGFLRSLPPCCAPCWT